MLTTLIYRSQVDPDRPLTDLDALIHRACGKNTPLGITGILLFNGLQFFQVLEGSERVWSRYSTKYKAIRAIAMWLS
jgi:hypothetical protein